ncbi:DUF3833 domain-containing protein [Terasakiella sp. A23]|uniref:DUF3833 domain-containing protein n=1 Tax=Terasakiella sp. FCG-A23 TaxID=3080561 RepID=UPI0029552972|nr:DUF3833 domain-containing protein [Terasakiella sp. A23]MDV7341272.1 DUF3833 domain-containing protein [Terasakiella sp. A23]
MKPEDFANQEPKLDLFDYFEGKTLAWGIFEDRFGTVRRQFQVDITGTINDNTLTLDEHFDYADGEKDQRIWVINQTSPGIYEGSAGDVLGTAQGISKGNALNWSYNMALKVGDSTFKVHFDDWMFLQKGNVMINRATVSKWGFEIGEVSLFFMKPANAS